jgi:hypothetical protein
MALTFLAKICYNHLNTLLQVGASRSSLFVIALCLSFVSFRFVALNCSRRSVKRSSPLSAFSFHSSFAATGLVRRTLPVRPSERSTAEEPHAAVSLAPPEASVKVADTLFEDNKTIPDKVSLSIAIERKLRFGSRFHQFRVVIVSSPF